MNTRALLVSTAVLLLLSCGPDIELAHPDPLFPEQALFKTTLLIRIMDEYGRPMSGVRVTIGPFVKESDYHGWVQWLDAVVTASAYIKVEKEGYFISSRRIYPSANSPNYLKFLMLSKFKTISFSTSSGRSAWIEGNFEINFPKDAYQLENGDSYVGEVNVAVQPLSIDDPDMSFKMPGDLTGLNTENKLGKLGSMGMIGVDLQTESGQKLKLAEGKKVEIKFPVSAERLSVAPASLPMWYYNEELGIWKEEGEAVLIGNKYVAQVGHFSFWNCDDYFELIQWGASFQNKDGLPLSYGRVCLTINALNTTACEYLDQDGKVTGGVAAHQTMSMQVYASCGQEVYSGEIGPYDDDIVTGTYEVDDYTYASHLTGTVYNCDNKRVTTGYVMINTDEQLYKVPVDGLGSFSFEISNCQQNPFTIQAFDISNLASSTVKSLDVAPAIIIDTIKACLQNEEYMVLDGEGFQYPLYFTPYSFWGEFSDDCQLGIGVEDSSCFFDLCLKNVHKGFFPNTKCHLQADLFTITDTLNTVSADRINLKIEKLGGPGGMVKGNFTGEFRLEYGNNVSYLYLPFRGEFSVRRE